MRKILPIVITTIAMLIFVVSIGIMFMATIAQRNNNLLYLFDTSFSLIPSNSMVGDNPDSLDQYDMAIIRNKAFEDLEVNDVIVFKSRLSTVNGCVNVLKIHRIVDGTPELGFITRGDNNEKDDQDQTNSCADGLITENEYQGALSSKITFLKPLVKILVESRNIIFPIVVVVLLIILCFELIHLFKEFNQEKKKKLEEEHEKFKNELEKQKVEEYERIKQEEISKLKNK